MKIKEKKDKIIQSVIEKRSSGLPEILKDGVIFSKVLCDRNSRTQIYDLLRENIGLEHSTYKNNTYKKWFLYPADPVYGIGETDSYQKIVKAMEFVLIQVLTEKLVSMRSDIKILMRNVKLTEKYLGDYEQSVK